MNRGTSQRARLRSEGVGSVSGVISRCVVSRDTGCFAVVSIRAITLLREVMRRRLPSESRDLRSSSTFDGTAWGMSP